MLTDRQFKRRKRDIIKSLDLAETYYIDGAPFSASACLLAATSMAAGLGKEAHNAWAEKQAMLAAIRGTVNAKPRMKAKKASRKRA